MRSEVISMRALTVCQPYAHLIAIGQKRVENRRWPTRYQGLLAIHAGKSRQWWTDEYGLAQDEVAWGAIVAVVRLVDCLSIRAIRDGFTRFKWVRDYEHTIGPFCWVLNEFRRLARPIPCDGRQGLWTPSADLTTDILRAVGGVA